MIDPYADTEPITPDTEGLASAVDDELFAYEQGCKVRNAAIGIALCVSAVLVAALKVYLW